MTNAVTTTNGQSAELAEQVAVAGDLSKLSAQQRMEYYRRVCDSLGINSFTQPFQYITLNGKLTLYATRTAADQLRKHNGVSLSAPQITFTDDLVMVTVTGTDKTGRTDTEIGAVSIAGLKGEARANAIMKAVTKSKRRLTLSICGLGWLDETEVETIRDARPVNVTEDGEIVEVVQVAAQAQPVRNAKAQPAKAAPVKVTPVDTDPETVDLFNVLQYGNGDTVSEKARDYYGQYVDEKGDAPQDYEALKAWYTNRAKAQAAQIVPAAEMGAYAD